MVAALLLADSGQAGAPLQNGRIYFASDRGGAGGQDIYSVLPDGSDLDPLTDNEEYEESPAVSPDGQTVAYVVIIEGSRQIAVINADGTGMDHDTRVLVKKSMRRTRSYSMSAYLNGDEVEVDPRVKVKLAQVQIQPASKIFVFIEEDMTSRWLGSFKVMPVDSTSLAAAASFASVPGAWHHGGCDLSFADGHVEFWRWYSSRKTAKPVSPATIRQELQNLRRLQEAIPKL
jgi:prepilin-type processing-associated H-X9-DG protein